MRRIFTNSLLSFRPKKKKISNKKLNHKRWFTKAKDFNRGSNKGSNKSHTVRYL